MGISVTMNLFIFILNIMFVESLSTHNVARIAVLLPADDRHMFSIKRVSPALDHAINETKRNQILPKTTLSVSYGDTKCSNADGMNEAVSFFAKGQVDVFFGPCCDYAAAPVARQVAYWNIPLITAGAMAKDFGKKMNKEFSVLTRVGANFNSLGYYLIRVFNRYKWKRIKLVYNPNGQESVMHRFCHIAADGVHYAFRTRKDLGNFTQAVHKFHKVEEVLRNLPETIGLDFGDRKLDNWNLPSEYVVQTVLLRSGDVESNPGPTGRELDDLRTSIIKQMQDSEKRITGDINATREDIKSLNVEISELRNELLSSKEEQEVIKQDITTLQKKTDEIEYTLGDIQDKIEDQERRNRRNNMVLYGVQDSKNETYTESKRKVLEILNSARETKELPPLIAKDIERAHRLPSGNTSKTRPIIVRMCHWEDKWHSVKLRGVLKDRGYGIANDLTQFQRKELYRLRTENPDSRFYFKGNKLVREEKENTTQDHVDPPEDQGRNSDRRSPRHTRSTSRPGRGAYSR